MSLPPSLIAMLQQRIGLDPASVGSAMIERAVRVRAALHKSGNLTAYVLRLETDEVEFQALVEALVVPETWFFRYPESLTAMTDLALRRLAERPGSTLRILSLPCSTGEEPYSIAMALLSAGVAPARFMIDAVDISERNIAAARHAVYGRNSFRGADLGFRQRYFSPDGNDYVLSPAVRGQVRLHLGNLLSPTLALPIASYDMVFCRNLLIYFDVDTQARSTQILAGLARADGLLFVGPAEASVLTRMGHPSMGVTMAFAFHASTGSLPSAAPAASTPMAPWSVPVSAPRAVGGHTDRITTAVRRSLPAATLPVATKAQASPLDNARDVAEAASFVDMNALADQGRFDDALLACGTHIERFGPSATAFYRQGLFHDAARRPEAAQEAYRKTLYLAPRHPQALLQLAALLEAAGDMEGAMRLRRRMSRRDSTQ